MRAEWTAVCSVALSVEQWVGNSAAKLEMLRAANLAALSAA
jgi:hypothetical protein